MCIIEINLMFSKLGSSIGLISSQERDKSLHNNEQTSFI